MSAVHKLVLIGTFVTSALAHGIVSGIVIGGKYYQGYSPFSQYQDPPPTVIGWSTPEDKNYGFVAPSSYSDPDIICHKAATPAGTSAKVTAGDTVELQWTPWPESHHGPVIDYLAKCAGKCESADKESLKFFKIDAGGLVDDASLPGTWASDKLIANNNSWTVTIPASIAPGNYVLRHEIIALHSALHADGAQNYPQCINLVVSSSGSDNPSGTLGTALYKEDDPGILINIYTAIKDYVIPGPKLYRGDGSSSATPSSPSSVTGGVSSSALPALASASPSSSSDAAPPSHGGPSSTTPGSTAGPVTSSTSGSSTSKCTKKIAVSSSSASRVSPTPSPVGTGSSIPRPLPSSDAPPPAYTAGASVSPTPAPPARGDGEMKALMGKIIRLVKQFFRSAEHGRDFRKA